MSDWLRHLVRPNPRDGQVMQQGAAVVLFIKEVVEHETGLPACEELQLSVVESVQLDAYGLYISWPGGLKTGHLISMRELSWVAASASGQFDLIRRAVQQMSREWLAAVQ